MWTDNDGRCSSIKGDDEEQNMFHAIPSGDDPPTFLDEFRRTPTIHQLVIENGDPTKSI
jgi:hypothetical protein